ncbi:hypothetical protein BSK56_00060 [Paenibacillus borealis]|uniref:Uncharacterized protein n=1 Tax=Paenibacillus borealis TaxID=160799 RepID=A0ABX3HTN5_PAEBO|nr:hypothetical protein [Paenibacillus borealis]OMD53580.1 hypothetical protein BSK56_00060 [Paenibacillus borealis]
MNDLTQQAKECFARYLGSFVQMHREGVLEQYKQYEIPREMELQWFQEMVTGYLQQLSIRDWEAVSALDALSRQFQDPAIVENTASFAARNLLSADSIVRLMYAESLVGIIRSNKGVIPRDLLFSACRTAVQLLESVIAEPLVIDPGHELQSLGLKDKRGLNSRAKKSIEEIEVLIN